MGVDLHSSHPTNFIILAEPEFSKLTELTDGLDFAFPAANKIGRCATPCHATPHHVAPYHSSTSSSSVKAHWLRGLLGVASKSHFCEGLQLQPAALLAVLSCSAVGACFNTPFYDLPCRHPCVCYCRRFDLLREAECSQVHVCVEQ